MVYLTIHNAKSRFTLWKTYAWFMLALFVVAIIMEILDDCSVAFYFDIVFSVIALLAIFGYAYQKRMLCHFFWKCWFVVFIGWEILSSFMFPDNEFDLSDSSSLLVVLTFAFIISLYLLPFR